nr:MAG TPA: hypothetical protein [Caudoviricetes sp.]
MDTRGLTTPPNPVYSRGISTTRSPQDSTPGATHRRNKNRNEANLFLHRKDTPWPANQSTPTPQTPSPSAKPKPSPASTTKTSTTPQSPDTSNTAATT